MNFDDIRAVSARALAILLVGVSLSLHAEPPPHAKGGHGKGGGGGQSAEFDARGIDGGGELRRAGISLATARNLAMSHRATGYDSLPLGIRKNLARGKPLPPGLAKRAVPGPLLADLPRYPGYEWQVAGSDLVLVAIANAVIADVLLGVFD